MRLLHTERLEFAQFRDDNRPKYVIASHRWREGVEATLQDVMNKRNMYKDGYKKIEAFARYIRDYVPSVEWLWIDTCCINKDSAAELSEAINLMFEWYRNAELCIVYLEDVKSAKDKSSFEKSEWFRRGWTLQELLAPHQVVFVSQIWQVIGSKGHIPDNKFNIYTGPRLEKDLARITGIPEQVLHDFETSRDLSVEERLMWIEGRTTTREEDMSYALYGIFDVAPDANYGEKHENARQRLLAAIHYQDNLRAERFRKIGDWLSPADPWTNHSAARSRHESHTGMWLIQSDPYYRWKSAATRHLWVYGRAGCGKTILCSTAIEDVKEHCQHHPNAGYAVFYFSYSDDRKQRLADLLRSLVVQLGWKGPALSMLQQAYDRPNRTLPGLEELEKILLSCFKAFDKVFLLIDALDECPEVGDVRHSMLECLGRVSRRAWNVQILTTSRELPDVRMSMAALESEAIPLSTRAMDADIRQYVAKVLARDHRLSRLDSKTKTLIEETISAKADGMFRWAYCQVQELKKLKSTRPKFFKEALFSLPTSLDETYERMLGGIDQRLRRDALSLLRWLVYAKSPLSLGELVDTTLINLSGDGNIDMEDRPGLDDILEILGGLVAVEGSKKDDDDLYEKADAVSSWPASHYYPIDRDSRVRLVHSSVKEYLESKRILEGSARDFHLESSREHRILSRSCLIYLTHYSSSKAKLLTSQDLTAFPLLQYAAESWFYHCALREVGTVTHEVAFLRAKTTLHDWLLVHQPDRTWKDSFDELDDIGSSQYYASFLGLEYVVDELLRTGVEINAQGGHYGNALQAASVEGHEKVVQMLLDAGAGVNTQGGEHGNALQAASVRGHERVVQMLLDAGADVNTREGDHGNAQRPATITATSVFRDSAYHTGTGTKLSQDVTDSRRDLIDTLQHTVAQTEELSDTASIRTDGCMNNLDHDTASALVSEFVDQLSDEFEAGYMQELFQYNNMFAIVEGLLRDYAALLKKAADIPTHEKAAIFIRHQRKSITTALKESANAWRPNAKDQLTWSEKVDNWQVLPSDENSENSNITSFISEARLHDRQISEQASGGNQTLRSWDLRSQDAKQDETTEQDILEQQEDIAVNDDASEVTQRVLSKNNIPVPKDVPVAKKFLLAGDEFVWLRGRIRNMVSCSPTAETFRQIRSQLADIISRLPNGKSLVLALDWDPLSFMKEQYTNINDLSKVLVFCGTPQTTFCATAQEYTHMVWPNVGRSLIGCLQTLCKSATAEDITPISHIRARMTGGSVHIVISAESSTTEMLEIGEASIWLSVACRNAKDDDQVACCVPYLTESGNPTQGFQVDVTTTTTSIPEELVTTNGTCWFGMVRNPVIAQGYPVRSREGVDSLAGLELSFDVMVALSHVDWATSFDRTFVMKGFRAALIPVLEASGVIIWHFLIQRDGRMSFLQACSNAQNTNLSHLDLDHVARHRHIVGFWTNEARFTAGTDNATLYEFELSESYEVNNYTCSLNSLNVSGGKFLNAGASVLLGKKDKSVALQIADERWSETILADSASIHVLFYGSLDRRAWLLDGTSALLHLTRAWMTSESARQMRHDALEKFHYAGGKGGQEECFAALDANVTNALKLFESHETTSEHTRAEEWSQTPYMGGTDSGYRSFPGSMKYKIDSKMTSSDLGFKHLVIKLWRSLEMMKDKLQVQRFHPPEFQIRLPKTRNHYLTGWDAIDIICKQGIITPRRVDLKRGGENWCHMVHDMCIPAFLARSFGDLILPRNDVDGCRRTMKMPTDHDYMAVPFYLLRRLGKRWLYEDKAWRGCMRIEDNWHWHGLDPFSDDCKQSHCECCVVSYLGRERGLCNFDVPGNIFVSNVLDHFAHGAAIIGGSRRIQKSPVQKAVSWSWWQKPSTTRITSSTSQMDASTSLSGSRSIVPSHSFRRSTRSAMGVASFNTTGTSPPSTTFQPEVQSQPLDSVPVTQHPRRLRRKPAPASGLRELYDMSGAS